MPTMFMAIATARGSMFMMGIFRGSNMATEGRERR